MACVVLLHPSIPVKVSVSTAKVKASRRVNADACDGYSTVHYCTVLYFQCWDSIRFDTGEDAGWPRAEDGLRFDFGFETNKQINK